MAITNYHTVNGEIIGETTSSVRTGYLTDGLGSITATQGSTGNVLATYRYKPYGGLLAKTGTGPDPRFAWTGAVGVRFSVLGFAEAYVRARTLSPVLGRWLTKDVYWPIEPAFTYAFSNPVTYVDPTGLVPSLEAACFTCRDAGAMTDANSALSTFCKRLQEGYECLANCLAMKGHPPPDYSCLDKFCKQPAGSIKCLHGPTVIGQHTICKEVDFPCPREWQCVNPTAKLPSCAVNYCQDGNPTNQIFFCCKATLDNLYRGCSPCAVPIGLSKQMTSLNCTDVVGTVFHELYHSCGPSCLYEPHPDAHDWFAKCVRRCYSIK